LEIVICFAAVAALEVFIELQRAECYSGTP